MDMRFPFDDDDDAIQSGIWQQSLFVSLFDTLITPLNLQFLYHQTLMFDLMLLSFYRLGKEDSRNDLNVRFSLPAIFSHNA
jgi:hypothetical protein